MTTSPTIRLAIIHHGDQERLQHLRPHSARLSEVLGTRYQTSLMEIEWQPPLTPHSTSVALLKDLWFWRYRRQWLAYRGKPLPRVVPSLHSYYRWRLRKYVGMAKSSDELPRWRRSSRIETILTEKHTRAWASFIDEGLDYLVVFEDDAVFRPDSVERMLALFASLDGRKGDSGLYVDLAGGLALDRDLGIDHLISGETDGFIAFIRPATNTTCAYLVDRPAARHFARYLILYPWIRLITIDWMINKMFMYLAREGVIMDCLHARPPIFNHGSLTGEYTSSIR